MVKRLVRLHYFGARDYIDISTLSSSFFFACGISSADPSIEAEAIRILKPVRRQGHLVEGHSYDSVCLFNYKYFGKKYSYSFVESEVEIIERNPEPQFDLSKFIHIQKNQVQFHEPLTPVMTYNLMVAGKALIQSQTDQIPRVVQTELRFNLCPQDYENLRMDYTPLKKNFILLQTTLNEKIHGKIFVKLI